ncbi:tail assembly protein [Glaesserella sp.]|uniref:tail assembly protein n=1 Tax=Glaesserella sp. TaxID=2094731 RepID=UPI00359F20EA
MVRVKFYGDLKRFEPNEPIELEVSSFKELMNGLLSQIQGLNQYLRKGYYKVRIGKRYLSEEQIKTNPTMTLADDCTVHFTPVVAGAGKNMNVMNIVIGVVLIAASWYAGGAAGWSYLGAQGFAGATMAFTMGASMVLSGVMGLLTKPPSMDTKLSDSEKQQSTSFSNLRNLTPQGRPIPLLYGKMMTSLVLISQGLDSYDDVTT